MVIVFYRSSGFLWDTTPVQVTWCHSEQANPHTGIWASRWSDKKRVLKPVWIKLRQIAYCITMIFNFFFLCVISVGAQTNDRPVKLIHYVLDSFITGKVKLKSGQEYNQLLNYNILTKEMIFEQEAGKYLAFAHPEQVDTVFIRDRKFVPVDNVFYEYLGGSTYPLFVEHTCSVKEQGAQTGFGRTNTTAATSYKSLLRDAAAYRLKLPDEFEVIPGRSYYIRKNGQYYKANNEQQIVKLFPDKKQFIKDWVRKNQTNISRQEELVLLIEQIQDL